jgi:hypothetical protein
VEVQGSVQCSRCGARNYRTRESCFQCGAALLSVSYRRPDWLTYLLWAAVAVVLVLFGVGLALYATGNIPLAR